MRRSLAPKPSVSKPCEQRDLATAGLEAASSGLEEAEADLADAEAALAAEPE